jgi:hypothetical protein
MAAVVKAYFWIMTKHHHHSAGNSLRFRGLKSAELISGACAARLVAGFI